MNAKNKLKDALKNNAIPYLIAETAYIFEGKKSYLQKIIFKLFKSKSSDAIKYHILIDIDSYSAPSYSIYALIKNFLLTKKEWIEILKKTKEKGFETIVLVDDEKAIDFVKKNIELVDAVELHAIALNNIIMLEKVKELKIPIVLGVGGSKIEEIKFAVNCLKGKDLLLMHGFQNYPTKYEYINFNRMINLKKKFNLPVGYADHCSWDHPNNELITLAGFMAGANIIEKHVALKAGEKRVDFNSAISVEQLKDIYQKMNLLNVTKGDGSFEITEYEKPYGKNGPMKFTPVALKNMKKEDLITKENTGLRRTAEENNVQQIEYMKLLGKKLVKDVKKFEHINWSVVKK